MFRVKSCHYYLFWKPSIGIATSRVSQCPYPPRNKKIHAHTCHVPTSSRVRSSRGTGQVRNSSCKHYEIIIILKGGFRLRLYWVGFKVGHIITCSWPKSPLDIFFLELIHALGFNGFRYNLPHSDRVRYSVGQLKLPSLVIRSRKSFALIQLDASQAWEWWKRIIVLLKNNKKIIICLLDREST